MDYNSTYPFTPYAPGVDPMNDMSNPDWASYAMDPKRRKLLDDLKNKSKNQAQNPALDESLPKKFVPMKEANAIEPMGSQVMPQKPRSSKIRDEGQIATKLPSFVKTRPSQPVGFNLQTPETPDMALPPVMGGASQTMASPASQPTGSSNNVMGYIPNNQPQMNSPSSEEGGMDFRGKLYEYLRRKISGDPMDANRLQQMGQARDYAAANQLGALFSDSASKMGTLQGKRSDAANFQPLIKSIYDRDMGKIGDEMALEQSREDSLLKGANLSSKLLRSSGPKAPKILPYYKPSTPNQPGEVLMYDEAGNLMPRQLPPGYEPNNPWSTLPMFMDPQGKPVVMQQNPVTGQTRQLPIPDNLKSIEQAKMEANNVMKKIDLDMRVAGEQRRGELMREQVRYQQYMTQLRQKEFELRLRGQDERERTNKANEQIKKDRGASGTGTTGGKITEAERKTGLQATVAIPALAQVEAMENGDQAQGIRPYRPGTRSIIGGGLGGTASPMGNKLLSDDDRLYDTASNNLVEMLLRSVTGAGAQKDEIKRILSGYKIMAGDDERTIQYKQNARRSFVQGLIDASGRAGEGKALPPQSSSRTIIDEKYSPSRNKTIIIYSDGTKDTLQGRRKDGQPKP